MDLARDIRSITHLKTRAAELVEQVAARRTPVVITQHGRARAVVVDVESYEELRRALLMLKLIAQGEADVSRGRVRPQAEVFERVGRRLRGGG